MASARFHRTVLPSGLRIVSEKDGVVKSVAIGVWIDVGSRYEPHGLNGLSHLIEHMTFKGTEKRNAQQIVYEFESRGGSVNAFTSREQTCYYAKVLDEHLAHTVEVLGDIVLDSLFEPKELRREQKVILEEIKDVHDTPADWVHDLFAETHWGKEKLGLPVLGVKSTVLRARRPDIMAYRARFYRPERMVIAACGEVSHKKLVDIVAKVFDHKKQKKSAPAKSGSPRFKGGLRVYPRESQQTHLVVGFPSLSYTDEQKYVLLVLQQLFGGGMSSRLFQTVREKLGLAYSVFSFQDSYRDCGVFGLYIGTDKKSAARALTASAVELGRLKREAVPAKELASAKEQLKGNLVLGLESTSSRMNRIARHEIYLQKQMPLKETLREIDRVSANDVRQLAREIIDPRRLTAVAMGQLRPGFYKGVDWSPLA
jgi:predicted Zn-dependent peptidase